MKKPRYFLFFPVFVLSCLTCKSAPPPEELPVSQLYFDHIEAENINQVILYYRLRLDNPRSSPVRLSLGDWKAAVNGLGCDREAAALFPGEGEPAIGEPTDIFLEAPGGGSAEGLLRLDLDLQGFRYSGPAPGESGDYNAELALTLTYQYAGEKPLAGETRAAAVFPRIMAPEFTITAIAILQAELINTRFRVNLRIDNPNVFPLALSSFGYELYGGGRFWADGQETDLLHIPAQGSAETRLFLMMNFINMKRSLLDEVIAMRQVRYRFTGKAEVGTGISWLPQFRMEFDHTGNSEVYK